MFEGPCDRVALTFHPTDGSMAVATYIYIFFFYKRMETQRLGKKKNR